MPEFRVVSPAVPCPAAGQTPRVLLGCTLCLVSLLAGFRRLSARSAWPGYKPQLPSRFRIVGKIGRESLGIVYRVSERAGDRTREFALKELGPVGASWGDGYFTASMIFRELKAYVDLKHQAGIDGLGSFAHTAEFHGCFRGSPSWLEEGDWAVEFRLLLTTCAPDASVEPGVFWFQVGIEGTSLYSYMVDRRWREAVLDNVANSPVPVVPLMLPPQLGALRRRTAGLMWGLLPGGWELQRCHIGWDGGFYTEADGMFQRRGELASVDVGDPAPCADEPEWWCFSVGDEYLSAASSPLAIAWVHELRGQSNLLRAAQRSLPLFEAGRIIREMLLGLRELKRAGLVHANIKPSNLLVPTRPIFSRRSLRWADMGFATWYEPGTSDDETLGMSLGATPSYAPPELLAASSIQDATDISPAYDMFSVGLIAFELLAGGNIRQCAIDDGIKDVDFLINPPGFMSYNAEAYNDIWVTGTKSFAHMPLLMQLLQVLGMPGRRAEMRAIGRDQASGSPIRYGNPYDHAEAAQQLRAHNVLFLERAIFALQAAIPGPDGQFPYAAAENRSDFKSLRSGPLSPEKYGAPKFEQCAQTLLEQRGLALDDTRLRGLRLVRSMLQVWPEDRISVEEAIMFQW